MGCSSCCRIRYCCCCPVRVCSHFVGWICVLLGLVGLILIVRHMVEQGFPSPETYPMSAGVIFAFFLLGAGFCTLLGIWAESVTILDSAFFLYCVLMFINIAAILFFAIAFITIELTAKCAIPLAGLALWIIILSIFMIVVNSYKFEKQEEEEAEYYDDYY